MPAIEVFNLLGEKVNVLMDRNLPAGRYSVTWNGDDLAGQTGLFRNLLLPLDGRRFFLHAEDDARKIVCGDEGDYYFEYKLSRGI